MLLYSHLSPAVLYGAPNVRNIKGRGLFGRVKKAFRKVGNVISNAVRKGVDLVRQSGAVDKAKMWAQEQGKAALETHGKRLLDAATEKAKAVAEEYTKDMPESVQEAAREIVTQVSESADALRKQAAAGEISGQTLTAEGRKVLDNLVSEAKHLGREAADEAKAKAGAVVDQARQMVEAVTHGSGRRRTRRKPAPRVVFY